jgi:hypothetical protein
VTSIRVKFMTPIPPGTADSGWPSQRSMLMDRGQFGAGASRDRFHLRSRGLAWLYDPVAEEFVRDPSFPGARGWDTLIRVPITMPQGRWGRLAYRLFAMGWMGPIAIGGPILVGIIAWLAGF